MFSSKSYPLTNGLRFIAPALAGLAVLLYLSAGFEVAKIPFLFHDSFGRAKESARFSSAVRPAQSLEDMNAALAAHSLFFIPKAETAAAAPGFDEMIKPFQLIGIIQGDNPEALIKNQTNEQTYFTRTGEKFDQFLVKSIQPASILVEFNGQTREIALEGGSA